SCEENFLLMRLIARRDLTLAISHGKTYLGSMPIWIAGDQAQQRQVAEWIAAGERVALGLTEESNGSDLLSGTFTAVQQEDDFELSGRKWLVNHAIKGEMIVLLVQTSEKTRFRDHSLFVLRKSDYEKTDFSYETIQAMGLRGLDLGAIQLDGLSVPATQVLGRVGDGLEVTLKTLQVTRLMCNAMSLGAADTAIRCCVKFLVERRLYNGRAVDLPVVKRELCKRVAEVLVCEQFTLVGTRAMHLLPNEGSLLSAISKGLIPDMVEEAMKALGKLLGARYLLEEGIYSGIFQKMLRDHFIIPVFDGNTAVNLQVLITQMRQVLSSRREASEENYHQLFRLYESLPPLQLEALKLMAKGKDLIWEALLQFHELVEQRKVADVESMMIFQMAERFGAYARKLQKTIQADRKTNIYTTTEIPAVYYDRAYEFGLLHLASVSIHLWVQNRRHLKSPFAANHWFLIGLHQIYNKLDVRKIPLETSLIDKATEDLIAAFEAQQLFSIYPIKVL
ncbi:MAG: acyl-CoA dehydrogenase, partial [Bacteroidota bacterium]